MCATFRGSQAKQSAADKVVPACGVAEIQGAISSNLPSFGADLVSGYQSTLMVRSALVKCLPMTVLRLLFPNHWNSDIHTSVC